MYPGDVSSVAGIVMFNIGADKSGLDLNCQSATVIETMADREKTMGQIP